MKTLVKIYNLLNKKILLEFHIKEQKQINGAYTSHSRFFYLLLVTSHINCILHFCTLPDKHCQSHGMCLYQVMIKLHFLKDVTYHAESTKKIENYVIIASLKSEINCKLINRIPGLVF